MINVQIKTKILKETGWYVYLLHLPCFWRENNIFFKQCCQTQESCIADDVSTGAR